MLAPYRVHIGPFWAIFGSVSAFALDLGISMSLNFRPCPAFAKNTKNTRNKYNLWTALLMVFAVIFCLFLFLSWGMPQLGYVCLISGLYWAIVGYVGTILGSCWAILVYSVVCICLCWAILGVFCGLCRALFGKSWDHIRLILGHFGLCWDILGHVGTILGSCWAIFRYFRIRVGLCFGLGHFSVVEFSSMQGVRRLRKTSKKTKKTYNLWTALLMVFSAISLFLFLSRGMLQLGYVCLISGLCWTIVG